MLQMANILKNKVIWCHVIFTWFGIAIGKYHTDIVSIIHNISRALFHAKPPMVDEVSWH